MRQYGSFEGPDAAGFGVGPGMLSGAPDQSTLDRITVTGIDVATTVHHTLRGMDASIAVLDAAIIAASPYPHYPVPKSALGAGLTFDEFYQGYEATLAERDEAILSGNSSRGDYANVVLARAAAEHPAYFAAAEQGAAESDAAAFLIRLT